MEKVAPVLAFYALGRHKGREGNLGAGSITNAGEVEIDGTGQTRGPSSPYRGACLCSDPSPADPHVSLSTAHAQL